MACHREKNSRTPCFDLVMELLVENGVAGVADGVLLLMNTPCK
ncbi:hypothetical protein [Desulforhopalus vacuolatus]|nr:hypothetical protein [Desulforhopalus vacuolatus]